MIQIAAQNLKKLFLASIILQGVLSTHIDTDDSVEIKISKHQNIKPFKNHLMSILNRSKRSQQPTPRPCSPELLPPFPITAGNCTKMVTLNGCKGACNPDSNGHCTKCVMKTSVDVIVEFKCGGKTVNYPLSFKSAKTCVCKGPCGL
ncbi:uncharacterized protein [Clytia hemisphaerica]|uniref:CTCK domain-containing protein n=1 Tax=Clytia hemisphaerica TaxID=252671 RepID=A0A7M5WRT1_9CNID